MLAKYLTAAKRRVPLDLSSGEKDEHTFTYTSSDFHRLWGLGAVGPRAAALHTPLLHGGGGCSCCMPPPAPACALSRDSPHLVVLHREVAIASECGHAPSECVGVILRKVCMGLTRIARMNAKIGVAKQGSVACTAHHCICSVLAFKAGGRVIVRILDQKQEAACSIGPATSRSPRCMCARQTYAPWWSAPRPA